MAGWIDIWIVGEIEEMYLIYLTLGNYTAAALIKVTKSASHHLKTFPIAIPQCLSVVDALIHASITTGMAYSKARVQEEIFHQASQSTSTGSMFSLLYRHLLLTYTMQKKELVKMVYHRAPDNIQDLRSFFWEE